MRKLTAALLAFTAVIATAPAKAYTIITDEALFRSTYSNPDEKIDFTQLKDGTLYLPYGASSSPLIHSSYSGTPGNYAVQAGGWSDRVEIGSTRYGCGCAWTASLWDGSSINPISAAYPYDLAMQGYGSLYLSFDRSATVAAISSTAGFMGFVPDGLDDTYYLIPRGAGITSLEFGYFGTATVAAPPQVALLLGGAIVAVGLQGRRKKLG